MTSPGLPWSKFNGILFGVVKFFVGGAFLENEVWLAWFEIIIGISLVISKYLTIFLKSEGHYWSSFISGTVILIDGVGALAGLPKRGHAEWIIQDLNMLRKLGAQ